MYMMDGFMGVIMLDLLF